MNKSLQWLGFCYVSGAKELSTHNYVCMDTGDNNQTESEESLQKFSWDVTVMVRYPIIFWKIISVIKKLLNWLLGTNMGTIKDLYVAVGNIYRERTNSST